MVTTSISFTTIHLKLDWKKLIKIRNRITCVIIDNMLKEIIELLNFCCRDYIARSWVSLQLSFFGALWYFIVYEAFVTLHVRLFSILSRNVE